MASSNPRGLGRGVKSRFEERRLSMSYDPHDHIARRSDIAAGFGIWLALLAGLAVGIGGLPGFSPADLSARSLSASVGMSQPSSPPSGC
jgi:hypothetical protein